MNKEMIELLKELSTSESLTENKKAVILAQLEEIEKGKETTKEPTKEPKSTNKMISAIERIFGKNAVSEKEGSIEIDLDRVDSNELSDAERRVEELEAKISKMEQQQLTERLNNMAFEAIKKEGYDPEKIASILNPADRLKIEGNKVIGLNDLMETIRSAGFQKTSNAEEYDILKRDWISDYKAKEEKSGIDTLMDAVFGEKQGGNN